MTLINELQTKLTAAIQAQLDFYKKNNTKDEDQLIWEFSASENPSQAAWYRYVNTDPSSKNGVFQAGPVPKTPITPEQISEALKQFTALMAKQQALELTKQMQKLGYNSPDQWGYTTTAALVKRAIEAATHPFQYYYLNVVEDDAHAKIIELKINMQPTPMIDEVTIYHYDDESDATVEARYKDLLKFEPNQKACENITVVRLQKKSKNLADDITALQVHLLNEKQLDLDAELNEFNSKFMLVGSYSPDSPSSMHDSEESDNGITPYTDEAFKAFLLNPKTEKVELPRSPSKRDATADASKEKPRFEMRTSYTPISVDENNLNSVYNAYIEWVVKQNKKIPVKTLLMHLALINQYLYYKLCKTFDDVAIADKIDASMALGSVEETLKQHDGELKDITAQSRHRRKARLQEAYNAKITANLALIKAMGIEQKAVKLLEDETARIERQKKNVERPQPRTQRSFKMARNIFSQAKFGNKTLSAAMGLLVAAIAFAVIYVLLSYVFVDIKLLSTLGVALLVAPPVVAGLIGGALAYASKLFGYSPSHAHSKKIIPVEVPMQALNIPQIVTAPEHTKGIELYQEDVADAKRKVQVAQNEVDAKAKAYLAAMQQYNKELTIEGDESILLDNENITYGLGTDLYDAPVKSQKYIAQSNTIAKQLVNAYASTHKLALFTRNTEGDLTLTPEQVQAWSKPTAIAADTAADAAALAAAKKAADTTDMNALGQKIQQMNANFDEAKQQLAADKQKLELDKATLKSRSNTPPKTAMPASAPGNDTEVKFTFLTDYTGSNRKHADSQAQSSLKTLGDKVQGLNTAGHALRSELETDKATLQQQKKTQIQQN